MQPNPQEEHNKVIIRNMTEACAKFQRVFSGTEGEDVLAMIAAQVPEIIFNKDPFVHAKNQGKRELLDFILNGCDDKKLQKKIEQLKKISNKEKKNV